MVSSANELSDDALPIDLLLVGIAGKQLLVRSSEIKEVLRPRELTPVPMGPEHVLGLANIHGQIVCMIDVGGVTSLPHCHRDVTMRTRFLLLRHPLMHVGIWVDDVHRMQQLAAAAFAGIDASVDSVCRVDVDGQTYDLLQCATLLHASG